MAVRLNRFPGFPVFDTVSKPAALTQRWITWKAEFELYVIASGFSDPTQKRAPLLHLAGPQVRDIFSNSIPADIRGGAIEYDKVIDILSEINK